MRGQTTFVAVYIDLRLYASIVYIHVNIGEHICGLENFPYGECRDKILCDTGEQWVHRVHNPHMYSTVTWTIVLNLVCKIQGSTLLLYSGYA